MAEGIMDLDGRVAVVVGGTSGLGRAIALGLARAGAVTVPTGRRGELVREACEEIERGGGAAYALTVDVAEATTAPDSSTTTARVPPVPTSMPRSFIPSLSSTHRVLSRHDAQ